MSIVEPVSIPDVPDDCRGPFYSNGCKRFVMLLARNVCSCEWQHSDAQCATIQAWAWPSMWAAISQLPAGPQTGPTCAWANPRESEERVADDTGIGRKLMTHDVKAC